MTTPTTRAWSPVHRPRYVNVTMHKVRRAGAAIDAAAKAVGNGVQLNGVSFTITNDSSLLRAARIRAMDNARLAAGQLARPATPTSPAS